MATLDQLLQAFNTFGQATEQYAVHRGIQNATDEVNRINQAQDLSFAQKIQQQAQVANQLQGRLSGLGASGSQIQAAVGSLTPQLPGTPEGNLAAAADATDPEAQGFYTKRAKAMTQLQEERMQKKEDFGLQLQEMKNAVKMANKTAAVENKRKPLTDSSVDKLTKVQGALDRLDMFERDLPQFEQYLGPWNSQDVTGLRSKLNPERANAKLQLKQIFDDYRIAVTGAGAGPTELKLLEKSTLSDSDSVAVTKQKMQTLRELGKQVFNRTLGNFEKAGRETSGFSPYEAPQQMIKVRLPNGREGTIPASSVDAFMQKNKGAQVVK